MLKEKLETEQRILDAYYAHQARGHKVNFRKFKQLCEDGQIDIRQFETTSQEEVQRRKALYKEAKEAGYIGGYEQWSKEMYWKKSELL